MASPSQIRSCNTSITGLLSLPAAKKPLFLLSGYGERGVQPTQVLRYRLTQERRKELIGLPGDLPPRRLLDESFVRIWWQRNGDLAKVALLSVTTTCIE